MVVGSVAEEELFGMTRKEVETELLKMPRHNDFKRFNTHLAGSEEEWAVVDKQLEKLVTWPKDKRECSALALPLASLQPSPVPAAIFNPFPHKRERGRLAKVKAKAKAKANPTGKGAGAMCQRPSLKPLQQRATSSS
jgi:hypothetical protein